MAPNKVVKADQSLIDQLCGIASVSRIVATNLLEACDNNLEMAINMQMEGVVTDSNGASSTQNEEDFVRAPIPQKREVLVEGPDQLSYSFRGRSRIARSVFDKFRDFEAETKRQEEELMEENGSSSSSSSSQASCSFGNYTSKRKMKTLEDLFRPPLDLIYRGNFQSARESGIASKKWLMVNVQNSSEFSCQVLNRDVWSNSAVKTIISEHFIFWQVYHDSEDGLRYMTFYPVNNWPYVAVIDPRTGEKLVEWHKIDAVSFCDLITEFLTAQPTMDDSFGVSKTPPRKKMKTNESIIEADENAQLEAAIKASLESTTNKAPKNSSRISGESSSDDDEESLETFGSDEETLGPVNRKNERGTPPVEPVELDDAMQVCSSAKDTVVEECPHVQVVSEIKVIPSENSSVHNSSGVIPLVPYKKRRHVSKLNEEDESNDGESDSSSEMVNEKDKWKLHLGKESDPLSKLILRLPDGTREVLEMPKSSKLMALVLYLSGKGFTNESYEIVTNFPRRKLSYMNFDSTLESIGLFPQETVFVQKR